MDPEPRFFSPQEAIATLPALKPLLAKLRDAFHEYRFAKAQSDELALYAPEDPERGAWEAKAQALHANVQAILQEINALGADVKDPILGLIDFYHRRESGEVVLLCYRDDEDTIRFWHDLERGFAGRRPLADL